MATLQPPHIARAASATPGGGKGGGVAAMVAAAKGGGGVRSPAPSQTAPRQVATKVPHHLQVARKQAANSGAKKQLAAAHTIRKARNSKAQQTRKAFNDIRRAQRETCCYFRFAPFARVFRDCVQTVCDDRGMAEGKRVERSAIEATREAVEGWLVGLFAKAQLLTFYRKNVTLHPKSIRVALETMDDPVAPSQKINIRAI